MNQNEELKKYVDLLKASENYGKKKFFIEIAVEGYKCYDECAEALEWPQLGDWLLDKIPHLNSILDSGNLEASLTNIFLGSGQSVALEVGAEGAKEVGTSTAKDFFVSASLITVDMSPMLITAVTANVHEQTEKDSYYGDYSQQKSYSQQQVRTCLRTIGY